jgi:hypothetical protein
VNLGKVLRFEGTYGLHLEVQSQTRIQDKQGGRQSSRYNPELRDVGTTVAPTSKYHDLHVGIAESNNYIFK